LLYKIWKIEITLIKNRFRPEALVHHAKACKNNPDMFRKGKPLAGGGGGALSEQLP
jgi:hypothetical protein